MTDDNYTIIVKTGGGQTLTDRDIKFVSNLLRSDGETEETVNREIERLKQKYGYKKTILMQCGHAATGPACSICNGIDPRAGRPEKTPDLTNRPAVCSCGKRVPSRIDLPLFEYRRYEDQDRFCCGHQATSLRRP